MSTQEPVPQAAERRIEANGGPTDDDALILWLLSLTRTERLAVAQGFADSVRALRPTSARSTS